jgi:hypothetical protein
MKHSGGHVEEKKESTPKPRLVLVCTGKIRLTAGGLALVFREVSVDGTAGPERIYNRKNLERIRVGAVYEVETDPEVPTQIYINTLRWLRLWGDKNEAALWQLAADAFDTRELAARQERKENNRKLPVELLEPIRKQYRETNAVGRLAIEVRILAYLRMVSL